ncbi:MAG: CDGSH iron-sulfur domain-containing protein [Thermoleophilia bacterium]|nr:CDGSH iron-sulfur domain-containing protein [Thermoleophilia bacterium]
MRFDNADPAYMPLTKRLDKGTYYWCRCGKTTTPPFCSGAHVGSGIEPLAFEVDIASTKVLCNCGLTKNPPYCDGSHARY